MLDLEIAPAAAETKPAAASPAPAAKPSKLPRILEWVALVLILAGHAALIAHYFAPAISEPDDNGYYAQGTLWAQTGKTWFEAQSDAQYIGMHWLVTPDQKFISRYPPGLAAVIALVDRAAGYRATLWINPAFSLLMLLGFFLAARRVASGWWAVVGTLALAINPTVAHHALSGDSHMGVACVLMWGIYLLLRWSDEGRLWQVFAAGLVLGCIPAIRYGDAIMGAGVLIFLLWHWRRFSRIWLHYLAAGIGALIPMTPILIRNQSLMGAFWRTGYSLTNEETGFSWAYFKEHFTDYVRQINGNGLGLLFGLGFVAMVWLSFQNSKRERRPLGLMLLTQTLLMLALYMAYYWAPQMNSAATLRFLLPIYGLSVLAGMCLMRELCGEGKWLTSAAVGIGVVLYQAAWGTSELNAQLAQLHYQKESLTRVTNALEKASQDGDVVIGSGNTLQHLDFVRKWKVADGSLVGMGGGGFAGGRGGGPGGPDGDDNNSPSPRQRAKSDMQRELYSGGEYQRMEKFAWDVSKWKGSEHKIFLVGTESYVKSWSGWANGSGEIIARVELPAMPVERVSSGFAGSRRFGGGNNGRRFGGGPPGGPGGPGGGGGGPMRGFSGESEIVIAEFTLGNKFK